MHTGYKQECRSEPCTHKVPPHVPGAGYRVSGMPKNSNKQQQTAAAVAVIVAAAATA